MEFGTILKLIWAIFGGVVTAIPFIVGLVKAVKAKRLAREEAEEAKAESAIKDELKNLVKSAEQTYGTIDKILKSQGSSAGAMKKAEVMKALKVFCLENGYAWNEDNMSYAVEREVEYTKSVNSNNADTSVE